MVLVLRQRIEIVLSSKSTCFLGDGDEGQKQGEKPVKDDRRGGAPGLHKRGTSAEDWGGSRTGRAARSLTGARGDSHPLSLVRTRQRRQASASGRQAAAPAGGRGAIAVRRRRPSGERAREHAVAHGEVPRCSWAESFQKRAGVAARPVLIKLPSWLFLPWPVSARRRCRTTCPAEASFSASGSGLVSGLTSPGLEKARSS